MPKWAKTIVTIVVAAPALLFTAWAANYLFVAKAANRATGQTYQGTVMNLMDARPFRDRFRNKDRIAVVRTDDKQEIFVHDIAGRFDGCESEDQIDYRMEESGVKAVEFVYVEGSCREP